MAAATKRARRPFCLVEVQNLAGGRSAVTVWVSGVGISGRELEASRSLVKKKEQERHGEKKIQYIAAHVIKFAITCMSVTHGYSHITDESTMLSCGGRKGTAIQRNGARGEAGNLGLKKHEPLGAMSTTFSIQGVILHCYCCLPLYTEGI